MGVSLCLSDEALSHPVMQQVLKVIVENEERTGEAYCKALLDYSSV